MTAGHKLRAKVHTMLRQAAADMGGAALEFDPLERWAIDRACAFEDRREQLQARLDAEVAAGAGAATLGNLSAEVRHLTRAVADLLGRVHFGADVAPPARRPGRPGGAARPVA
jgi:hypothetical protein